MMSKPIGFIPMLPSRRAEEKSLEEADGYNEEVGIFIEKRLSGRRLTSQEMRDWLDEQRALRKSAKISPGE
jgi:hypothetical protein